jgi:hypothetical protein
VVLQAACDVCEQSNRNELSDLTDVLHSIVLFKRNWSTNIYVLSFWIPNCKKKQSRPGVNKNLDIELSTHKQWKHFRNNLHIMMLHKPAG